MPRLTLPTVLLIIVQTASLATTHVAWSQCDYGYTGYPTSDLHPAARVLDMLHFDDGSGESMIVGGVELLFTNGVFMPVAQWDAQRFAWKTLGMQLANKYVTTLCVFEGSLYAGTALDNRVWRYNGSDWNAVANVFPGTVSKLIVFDDQSGSGPTLFAASQQKLFKLSDGIWQVAATFNGNVSSLILHDGQLVAAGSFTSVDEQTAHRIAQWNGVEWTAFADGIPNGSVAALAPGVIDGVQTLVVGGKFSLDNRDILPSVATWNGKSWRALAPFATSSLSTARHVNAVAIWDRGDGPAVIATVNYQSYHSGDDADSVLRFNASLSNWQFIAGPGRIPTSFVRVLKPVFEQPSQPFATLYIGGYFNRVYCAGSSVYLNGLARLKPLPNILPMNMPQYDAAVRGSINSFAVFNSGEGDALYASGVFNDLPTPGAVSTIARYDGKTWISVSQSTGIAGIQTLDVGDGPSMYAFGSFTSMAPSNDQPRFVARFDGQVWQPVGNLLAHAIALASHDDGSGPALHAAYRIGTTNPMIGVKYWHADSSNWIAIPDTLSAADSTPTLLAMISFDDGTGPALYIAGRFDAIGNVAAKNIARWCGPSLGWGPVGAGMVGEVTRLHVHNDGSGAKLLANQTYVGGVSLNRLSQWDGNEWSHVSDRLGTFNDMATLDDGSGPSLYLAASRSVRWNGKYWSMLPPGSSANRFAVMNDALYMSNPFGIFKSEDTELAILSQTQSGTFPTSNLPIADLQVTLQYGGTVRLQWFRNGVAVQNVGQVSGANAETLRIVNLNGSFEGTYQLAITNDCTTIHSEPIELDVANTCFGDVVVSNAVDVADLLAVITAWGSCPTNNFASCPSDLTLDRIINVADLVQVINAWGPCQ